MMKRTDFGKRVFQEFNFRHWIEIRKHPCSFQVYGDMDECLEAARNRLDENDLRAANNLLWAIEMEIKNPECVDTPWKKEVKYGKT